MALKKYCIKFQFEIFGMFVYKMGSFVDQSGIENLGMVKTFGLFIVFVCIGTLITMTY